MLARSLLVCLATCLLRMKAMLNQKEGLKSSVTVDNLEIHLHSNKMLRLRVRQFHCQPWSLILYRQGHLVLPAMHAQQWEDSHFLSPISSVVQFLERKSDINFKNRPKLKCCLEMSIRGQDRHHLFNWAWISMSRSDLEIDSASEIRPRAQRVMSPMSLPPMHLSRLLTDLTGLRFFVWQWIKHFPGEA